MTDTIDAIWKYTVPVNDRVVSINLPVGAEIVHVGCQNSDTAFDVQFWATVPKSGRREPRDFLVVGTGQQIPGPGDWGSVDWVWTHRGTVLTHGGRFVWHLMERVEE